MKEALVGLLARTDRDLRPAVAREWLQAAILDSLGRSGSLVWLAFHGGTAIRFLYGIARFSEDLDFTHEGPEPAARLLPSLGSLKGDLWREMIPVRVDLAERPRLVEVRLDFKALAAELGLAAPELRVKIEINTDPPRRGVTMVSVTTRYRALRIPHHDPATLFAGKLHAVLMRHYTKGRDLYDLMWYLGRPRWPDPNLDFLNDALKRSGWSKAALNGSTWLAAVQGRLAATDWKRVRADVAPFLETPEEASLLTEDVFQDLLERRRLRGPRR